MTGNPAIAHLRDALETHPDLGKAGTVTEYLPALEVLTYRFNGGLSVQVAAHPGGNYQATLDAFYALAPTSADKLIDYLANLPEN